MVDDERAAPEGGTDLMPIGELARRAGVATSAVRYYERRGLLAADERRSGQRRYRPDALRLLVFIGMLQDAGLSLDDIDGMLSAARVEEWKAIARQRLEALDEEIARLQDARSYLEGALLCRFDHPATDCQVMGAEIDRRLDGQLNQAWARLGTAVICAAEPSGNVWSTRPWSEFTYPMASMLCAMKIMFRSLAIWSCTILYCSFCFGPVARLAGVVERLGQHRVAVAGEVQRELAHAAPPSCPR